MPPESLTCKECKTEYPLDASYVCERCFGPLEVAYAPHGDVERRGAAPPHPGGPALDLALPRLPAADERAAARHAARPAGRRCCAPTASPQRLGLREVWIKNDAANPTHSFKDRVVAVALARAKELGYADDRVRLDGQPRQRRRRARGRGRPRVLRASSRPTSRSRRSSRPASTARTLVAVRGNYDDVNRLCTEIAGEHEWAFVNINMRPYYAEGSKTIAYEIAEQLGWAGP